MSLCALALAWSAIQDPAPEPPRERVVDVALEASGPVLEGHGPSQRVEHALEFRGALFAWVSGADGLDTFLRAEDGQGKPLGEDDDSGGKPVPFLNLPATPGAKLVFVVAAARPGTTGRAQLHLFPGVETEATSQAAAAAQAALAKARTLAQKDLPAARGLVVRAIDELLSLRGAACAPGVLSALSALGGQSYQFGDLEPSERARDAVVAGLERAFPPDHALLQQARSQLVWSLRARGNLARARLVGEQALAACQRALPEDHSDLQWARLGLAWTLRECGDLERSRDLAARAVEVRTRTLPADHPDLQWARANLADTLQELGDLKGARELQEGVLEVRARTLPPGSLDLAWARSDLGWTLFRLGEFARARELLEQVVEVRSRSLPEDHHDLRSARANLAAVLYQVGQSERALALQEQVLASCLRTLPPGTPDLISAEHNLALTARGRGDLRRSRQLLERVVAAQEQRLPPDNQDLLRAQANLAETLRVTGDAEAALALIRRVAAVQERVLSEEDQDLSATLRILARSELAVGHTDKGLSILRRLVESQARRLPPDHPSVLDARTALARALHLAGDPEAAATLFQEVLATSGAGAQGRPQEAVRKLGLAVAFSELGRRDEARALYDEILAREGRILPAGDPLFQIVRADLLLDDLRLGRRPQAELLAGKICSDAIDNLAQSSLAWSPREAEGAVRVSRWTLNCVLRAVTLARDPAPQAGAEPALKFAETIRALGLCSRRALRADRTHPRSAELRKCIQDAAAGISQAVHSGAASAGELEAQLRRKSAAEVALRELCATQSPAEGTNPVPDLRAVARVLGEHGLGVSYWLDDHDSGSRSLDPDDPGSRMLAGILAGDGSVRWLDLGPGETIARAVERWRAAVCAPVPRGTSASPSAAADEERAAGEALARLVVAPLRVLRPDATRWVVALDDVLHLVPLDALPDGAGVLGDRVEIDVVTMLAQAREEPLDSSEPPTLLALGGIEFDLGPEKATTLAAFERSGAWERAFAPLPETREEVRAIESLFAKSFPDSKGVERREEREATKQALGELGPRARFLHLATHGFFAPEVAPAGPGMDTSPEFGEEVRGLSPWSLCGLALAGANRPPDELGRLQGVITGEELAALDLSRCELAVLSACETNAGVRRAGLGVASLQAALHAAGAHSAITSLWRVPDAATRELMVDFYRRLWIDRKPPRTALWEAKCRLRQARDELGRPRYGAHDWAAWVLTGAAR